MNVVTITATYFLIFISVIHTTFCVTCWRHCWFGVWFNATDYIFVCISQHYYLMVWLRTSVGWEIRCLTLLVICSFINKWMKNASYLVQFTQYWWILSLYVPGGHGSHPSEFIQEISCSQMCIFIYSKDRSVISSDSPAALGWCPLPHSLMQLEHLSLAHRYPGLHSQTVSLLAVQFTFTCQFLPGAEDRTRPHQNTIWICSMWH